MKTSLYDRHVALGAKFLPFAGFEMPIQYQGILAEHQAVREAVGLFDVSHMGQIHISGKDAEKFLDFISTNQIAGKKPGTLTYTVLCHANGTSVDDVIVYKIDEEDFFLVVNASNRQKDLRHLQEQAYLQQFQVEITHQFVDGAILACQGPQAEALLSLIDPSIKNLKPMTFSPLAGEPCQIARAGYTGAGGYEIYGPSEAIVRLWDRIFKIGEPFGLQPIGLGARDTLRLEMGFALYGQELSDTISPIESVSAWTVKMAKPVFLGKQALMDLEKSGAKRYAYGIQLLDKGVIRHGYFVWKEGKKIGEVTSGTFSPTLKTSIGLILVTVPLMLNEIIQIEIRSSLCEAQIVNLPFIRKTA